MTDANALHGTLGRIHCLVMERSPDAAGFTALAHECNCIWPVVIGTVLFLVAGNISILWRHQPHEPHGLSLNIPRSVESSPSQGGKT